MATDSLIKFKNIRRKRNIRNVEKTENCETDESTASAVVNIPKLQPIAKQNIHKTQSFEKNNEISTTSVNFTSGELRDRRELATSNIEIDTEIDRDPKAIFEKHLKQSKEGVTNDGLYHGLSGYKSYIEKKDTSIGNASSSAVHQGPVRASQNIRVTTRWDYHPELCKDYNETGFCGFGDSCKFIHDRTDYKSGWEIDKEYEENKPSLDAHQFEIHDHKHDSDDEVSLTCLICRNHYVNPVKTKCGHYFCEQCALDRFRQSGRCFECGTQTYGIFNPAADLMKKIEKYEQKQKANEDSENENYDPDDLLTIGENSQEIVNECEENEDDASTHSTNDSDSDSTDE